MKKIFILIPWFHPAYKAGGPIQSIANMVEQLAVGSGAVGFKIFCGNKDLDGSLLKGVVFDEWVQYNAQTKIWYSTTDNFLPVLQQEIKKENPDWLFITGIYSWQYNFMPLLFCKGVKKIISARGMLHPGALSQKSFKKNVYLQLWKMLGLHRQHIFHATDEAEKKFIQDVFGNAANIKVAANFPGVLGVQPVVKKKQGQLKLISVALIGAMKNILLILETLEKSCEKSAVNGKPSVTCIIEYNIYGPVKDKKYWDACVTLIKKLPANITVNYHGDIEPGKIVDALAANHVFILPSKSENYGHAIYEALSAGRPVITSNATPWNNLQNTKAGINVSVNDTTELVNAIKLFAGMNQEELEAWSNGAGIYAKAAVDLAATRRQYEEMFS